MVPLVDCVQWHVFDFWFCVWLSKNNVLENDPNLDKFGTREAGYFDYVYTDSKMSVLPFEHERAVHSGGEFVGVFGGCSGVGSVVEGAIFVGVNNWVPI